MEKINYQAHQWVIFTVPFGQMGGYPKHSCFLCLSDSAIHEYWISKEKPSREYMVGGGQHVINKPLVARDRILL